MANHDPNHSSTERTLLWTILPATIFVSLLFTNLNHKMEPPREALSAEMGITKKVRKESPAIGHEPMHAAPADTAHVDTTHTEQHQPAAH